MKAAMGVVVLLLASAALALPPGTDLYLISTGRLQGQCPGGVCALWRTDAWINNPSTSQAATVTVHFLVRDAVNSSPTTAVLTVQPGQTVELADIFNHAQGFNLNQVAGALRFTSTVPVVVTGRMYDSNVVTNKGAGTAGMFYPGLSSQLAIGSGQSTDVIGLAHDATWRSNLAFVETAGAAATLRIDRLNPANGAVIGTIASYQIRAREAKQINDVIAQLGTSSAANQRLRVTVTAGTGRVLMTANRIDNRTGDPYNIEMTTAAVTAARTTGVFEGVVLAPAGTQIDGGTRVRIGATGISSIAGVAGVPCGTESFTVEFDATNNPPVALGGDGSFAVTIPNVTYGDGAGGTVFTITWTLSGALSQQGVLSGTLRTVTTGGSGEWASCNGTVDRNWRAGWAGDS